MTCIVVDLTNRRQFFASVLLQPRSQGTLSTSREYPGNEVGPIIDHEFRHNIVKAAVDPRGDSRVDSQTTLTM